MTDGVAICRQERRGLGHFVILLRYPPSPTICPRSEGAPPGVFRRRAGRSEPLYLHTKERLLNICIVRCWSNHENMCFYQAEAAHRVLTRINARDESTLIPAAASLALSRIKLVRR